MHIPRLLPLGMVKPSLQSTQIWFELVDLTTRWLVNYFFFKYIVQRSCKHCRTKHEPNTLYRTNFYRVIAQNHISKTGHKRNVKEYNNNNNNSNNNNVHFSTTFSFQSFYNLCSPRIEAIVRWQDLLFTWITSPISN